MNLDGTLRVLADEKRRNMIYALEEADGEAFTYSKVVETMLDYGAISEEDRDRFQIEMTHVHLPRMQEQGIIEYDERSEIINYDPQEEIEEIAGFVEEFD